MKLTGPQRDWIGVSLFLAILVSVGTWLTLPSGKPINQAWANASLSVVKQYDDLAWVSAHQVKMVLFGALDDEAVISAARQYARESYERSLKANPRAVALMLMNLTMVDQWYGKQLAATKLAQRRRVSHGGTLWLILTVLAYAVISRRSAQSPLSSRR